MKILSETHTKAVSGGLDPTQATYAAVLSAQAFLGLGVLGACRILNANTQNPLVTHAIIPTVNIFGYVVISELSNWYYAKDKQAAKA